MMTPFGQQLKRYLVERRFSQRYLAERIGIDAGYISRVMHGGKAPPSRSVIDAIAVELRLSEQESQALYTAAGISHRKVIIPMHAQSKEYELMHWLAGRLGRINDEQLTRIRSIIGK
ncbi:helix-turn-helix domain-containing protein [Gilvimarinus agarilyticus]|nr:helix-turn-helix domain-containing protein [Gilvimarinus agarilyticus]